jgi:hypothetical protein
VIHDFYPESGILSGPLSASSHLPAHPFPTSYHLQEFLIEMRPKSTNSWLFPTHFGWCPESGILSGTKSAGSHLPAHPFPTSYHLQEFWIEMRPKSKNSWLFSTHFGWCPESGILSGSKSASPHLPAHPFPTRYHLQEFWIEKETKKYEQPIVFHPFWGMPRVWNIIWPFVC